MTAPDKCGLCGTSFSPCEIPFTGLCSGEKFHAECYRDYYGAIEYEPEQCQQSRHRHE